MNMVLLVNNDLGKNVNFTFFWKKITFIFLAWTFITYNDVCLFPKSLEKIQEQDKALNIKYNRLLARDKLQRELEYTNMRQKLSDGRRYKKEINFPGDVSIYSQVKKNEPNNFDVYMKNYNKRYMKKKGLSKLDCYCENKVFSKFCHIRDIAEKMNYDKKRSKMFFLKKYGIGLILFVLIPALGLIFPILFGLGDDNEGIFSLCPGGDGASSHFVSSGGAHKDTGDFAKCTSKWMYDHKDTIIKFGDVSYIFSFIMIAIVLLVVFYILIKIIKYEKIKSGKGKMSVKDYYRFCKNIF